ncbi:lipopolysaccharide biosynthesis protein [Collinsella sp. SGI.033]|uniref:lipopolysaccharide biosynthesis protein n=1 Tax=Collinsella sp. SGI.033 TaxID=3420552 RepID=UPI003D082D71
MANKNSRIKNALLASLTGVGEQLASYVGAFIFRTVFLYVLNANYLGISALFTNILQVFSLTELGIGSVIAFNMYKPIKECDDEECAKLLNFYKSVYRAIALITLLLGVCFFPFIDSVIADPGNIPDDVNLSVIYWLFVFQSVTSYLCVYRQSLLNADQKGYVISAANSIYNICLNVIKIILLIATANYTFVLAAGIIISLLYNFGLSCYSARQYPDIIAFRDARLSNANKIRIFKETGALMCHKIGGVVLNSTDSIILSSFIGVGTVGLYSNYQLISSALDLFLNKVFGSFVPTIGNALIDAGDSEKLKLYQRLRFINIWAASFCALCFYLLINPFIKIWIGDKYLLDQAVVTILSLHFFWNSSRIINVGFVNASGLFVKDKIRPLIQAVLNLVISVYAVIHVGIVGVFIGTFLSTLFTSTWREGVVLYKYLFHYSCVDYFKCYLGWFIVSLMPAIGLHILFSYIPESLLGFVIRLVIAVAAVNFYFWIVFRKTESYLYMKQLLSSMAKRAFTR